jgi:hypothetical protein
MRFGAREKRNAFSIMAVSAADSLLGVVAREKLLEY